LEKFLISYKYGPITKKKTFHSKDRQKDEKPYRGFAEVGKVQKVR
jgi:hypothetical protein